MKSLAESLISSLYEGESGEKILRFEFGNLENKDEIIQSILVLSQNNGIYCEKIDNGIKIKVNDSNRGNLTGIQDVLQQYVDNLMNSEDVNQTDLSRISAQTNELNEFIDYEPEVEDGE